MDRKAAIEKLWRNSNPGTKWSEVANAYDAGVAAERERCAALCERHMDTALGYVLGPDCAAAIRGA